ncbi:DUF1345 domain-containing protein [Chitinophaga ginsengisoli]|uniref:Putative membrane protein n=1 Tax=Chitinophaga ginsengisoli TaxID=363837 RepID=A0A2P8GHZ4_9BACT|nr:DUF1345 domain-containing protein [Chitinophaga ginsengisoli]PSL33578.1 putative membrane protein [Chitinophaga ginsengisoli]
MRGRIFVKLHPIHRILISAGIAGLVFVFTQAASLPPLIKVVLLWDVFALAYNITCWFVFFNRSVDEIRKYARKEDGSRAFVFVVILLASFVSMLMVLLLMISDESKEADKLLFSSVAIAGILLSWAMVHTMFAFHYAHIYYDDDEDKVKKQAGGLEFPEEPEPDYLDFAYFSFVIGMTFQVSDVQISDRKLRRIVLVHGLLAFLLNTFVVALTINLVAGLRG